MRKLTVYVDNSVFGGVYDEEFSEDTRRFFEGVRQGRYVVLVSDVLLNEIADAPQRVQDVLTDLPKGSIKELPITDEVADLAQAYVQAGVVGARWRDDATQIAAATVFGASLLLSWNFRHIVNFEKIRRFNSVNLANGYGLLDIRSPKEIGYGDDVEDV